MLASLLAVSLYPVLRTIWLGFRNTSLAIQGDKFTGLANVRRLTHDAIFWKAWRQTLEFTAISTLVETLLGLLIALALYKKFRGRGLVRAAVLVPWAIRRWSPPACSAGCSTRGGVVNYLLVTLQHRQGPGEFPRFDDAGAADADGWPISEDHAVHGVAAARRAADHPAVARRGPPASTGRRPGSTSAGSGCRC